jgi:hypothetical protein
VNWLSRKYGSLDVSQPYGLSRLVRGIVLLFFYYGSLNADKRSGDRLPYWLKERLVCRGFTEDIVTLMSDTRPMEREVMERIMRADACVGRTQSCLVVGWEWVCLKFQLKIRDSWYTRCFRYRITTVSFFNQSVSMQLQWFAARDIAVEEMATPLHEMKCVLWCNKTKWLKRVQRRYRGAFEETPPPLLNHIFILQFCETGYFVKGIFTLLWTVRIKLEYHLHVHTSSTCIEDLYSKIDFGSCNLISECSNVVSCLLQNIFPKL